MGIGETTFGYELNEVPDPEKPTNPEPTKGNRALLVVTMTTGLEKEFDLSMEEVNAPSSHGTKISRLDRELLLMQSTSTTITKGHSAHVKTTLSLIRS
ncbi:hypothetical protein PBN151_1444 [Paenibacillus sp. NAIST15-1]|nr:hypothetical protein PBN151_1444 [Paenibacillus sp. NAIST15-1]